MRPLPTTPKWRFCFCQFLYVVATALLHAACAGLKTQGLVIAEASPISAAPSDAQNRYGPLSMYLAAGFQVHRKDDDGNVYVRRPL